ncbi:YadA-like family protein, partial [Sphingosinicella sp. CPCC 101087]|uniref:YadA-like family protein n=1 Tax=Sphingosinicella sp. CPCC 101087 TaxID=2497754 RepID=UPI00197DBC3F
TDGVNVQQLNDGLASTLASAKEYTDTRIAAFDYDLGQLRRDANAGIASAVAISNIPQAVNPGRTALGLGTGYRDGEFAVAVGLSTRTDDDRATLKATMGYDSREVTLGAGVGVEF